MGKTGGLMASPTVIEQPTHPALRNQVSRVPYLPGLDGLRAIAVAAVMVYHANHGWLTGGFLGVEVFFVISGYLITLLLLSEKERTGRVSLRKFWMRRARRLLPALYTMMGALAIYMVFFEPRPMGQTRGDFLAGFVYISNWFQIWVGQSYTAAEAFSPLRHLWSLAVEEQFYMVWPVVMAWILHRRRDRLPRVALWLVGIAGFITVVMGALYVSGAVFLGADPVTGAVTCGAGDSHGYLSVFGHCINVNEALYLGTPTRLGGLLLGSAFAIVWRPVAIMRGPLRSRGRRVDLAGVLGLGGLVLMMNVRFLFDTETSSYDPWLFRGGFFIAGLFTLACIAAATHRRSWLGKVLGIRPLNWVGTRSYGLYLYHWPIYQIIREPGTQLSLRQFGIALLITVPVTELSYRLVELPVRQGRLGEWMRGERPPRTRVAARRRRRMVLMCCGLAVLAGFATVSIATADVLCVGQIECDSQRGQQAIDEAISKAATSTVPAATLPPITSPPVTVPAKPGVTTPPTTVAPSTTENPTLHSPVYAVGESVMLGAAPNLQAGGINVNAAVSRQGKNVAAVVAVLREANLLGKVVIIQTGTNGPVSDNTFDAIMKSLPARTTPLVVFLTIHAQRGWVADNNVRIAALPKRYSNVKVLDWNTAAVKVENELSRSDGRIHLATAHAKQYYANLIFDAVGRPDLKK
jgi:peptidoglycan/LPS O-acetylase OafA/YrhL